MIGMHPEMYGLPEVNLFCTNTLEDLLARASRRGYRWVKAGLLRVIAELHAGEQTDDSVAEAEVWLAARVRWSTRDVYVYIAEQVAPRRCVDKSPPYTQAENMARLYQAFPHARVLLLGRHPRGSGISRHKVLTKRYAKGAHGSEKHLAADVEELWTRAQTDVIRFTSRLPPGQYMFLQGEHLLSDPDRYLPQIAAWLGIDAGLEAIEAMKHPERSPYARPGPANAKAGNNPGFMQDPVLRVMNYPTSTLEGPLEWLDTDSGFSEETKQLARQLGYR